MSFWSRRKGAKPAPKHTESTPEEISNPCPICTHLNDWYGDDYVIRPIMHGAGGPDYDWGACYEHYQTITALQWLVWTDKMDFRLYPPKENIERNVHPAGGSDDDQV